MGLFPKEVLISAGVFLASVVVYENKDRLKNILSEFGMKGISDSATAKSASAGPKGCTDELPNWLGDFPEEGMHVVCLTRAHGAQIYRNGLESDRVDLSHDNLLDSESFMDSFFGWERELVTDIVYLKKGPELEELSYRNQRPVMYRADGLTQEGGFKLSEGLYIIFEGGSWRWPPIRVGFSREVPGGRLVTESVSPAVFFIHVDPAWHQWLREHVEDWDQGGSRFREANLRERDAGIGWIPYKGPMHDQIQKSAAMVNLPQNRFEDNMQAVRYKEQQFYDGHRDYWDPREFPNDNWLDKNGRWKNRLATILWYVHAPDEGGETWFPQLLGNEIGDFKACDERGVLVKPLNGTAMLFYSLLANGRLDEKSWHAACPVRSGKKLVANSWVWSGPYK